jgi:branched-chain amino acid transport system substrate-binding protein
LPSSAAEGADIIRVAREFGLNVLFIGTDLWHDEKFIKEGEDAVEGSIFTTYFDTEQKVTEESNEFLRAYKEEYGEGTPDPAVAMGFDAYLLAIHAIEHKGDNSIRDSLANVKGFLGATGSIIFDADGDPIKPVMLITVENGEYKHKYTVEPQ